ncbi:hypothetical protein OA531_01185 [Candidatus Pelagibacter sp.]|nr:hypothetical protein [Candidatus Pelagibacter sp.]
MRKISKLILALSFVVSVTSSAFAVTVASWGGAYTDSQKQGYGDPTAAALGIDINWVDYSGGLSEIKAQKEAGAINWDIIDVFAFDTINGCDEGLFVKFDFDKDFPAAPDGTPVTAHEDGKADYSSEVATLASAGGEAVAVIGYLDQGGKGIIQASLDSGAFDKFILSDGMIGQSLVDAFGKDLSKSFGSMPGSTGKGAGVFADVAKASGIDSSGPYTGESYDAAALIVLAMQAGNSADRSSIAKNVMDVANAPGTKIYPGELKKGLDLLAKGKKINYEGATGVAFTAVGEAEGSFLEQEIKGGKFKTKKQR